MAADGGRHDRELLQAGRRGDPRHRARRRARGRARLPLPGGGALGQAGRARGQARPAARRRRHPAPAARGGGRPGARNGDHRQDDLGARGMRYRAGRPPGRGRPHPARGGLCRRGQGHPPAAQVVGAGREAGRGARQSRPVRPVPQGQCAQIPRLRGAGSEHPVHRGGGDQAVRRGRHRRAHQVHGADGRHAGQGPAIFLLLRAQGGQDRRRRRGRPAAAHRQGRRDRRRDDGRRDFDELPVGRDPGDHRRNQPGSARPRHRRDAQELRGERRQGPDHRRAGRARRWGC